MSTAHCIPVTEPLCANASLAATCKYDMLCLKSAAHGCDQGGCIGNFDVSAAFPSSAHVALLGSEKDIYFAFNPLPAKCL